MNYLDCLLLYSASEYIISFSFFSFHIYKTGACFVIVIQCFICLHAVYLLFSFFFSCYLFNYFLLCMRWFFLLLSCCFFHLFPLDKYHFLFVSLEVVWTAVTLFYAWCKYLYYENTHRKKIIHINCYFWFFFLLDSIIDL